MHIRVATKQDAELVREIYLSAFPETESKLVSDLAIDLLLKETTPPALSLVKEIQGEVVGHVAFSPVINPATKDLLGYILAPLAVRPDHQMRGVGSDLVMEGIACLAESASGVLLVYGDPKYYSKFGFRSETAESFTPPFPLKFPFGWQGLALNRDAVPRTNVSIACVSPLNNPALW